MLINGRSTNIVKISVKLTFIDYSFSDVHDWSTNRLCINKIQDINMSCFSVEGLFSIILVPSMPKFRLWSGVRIVISALKDRNEYMISVLLYCIFHEWVSSRHRILLPSNSSAVITVTVFYQEVIMFNEEHFTSYTVIPLRASGRRHIDCCV